MLSFRDTVLILLFSFFITAQAELLYFIFAVSNKMIFYSSLIISNISFILISSVLKLTFPTRFYSFFLISFTRRHHSVPFIHFADFTINLFYDFHWMLIIYFYRTSHLSLFFILYSCIFFFYDKINPIFSDSYNSMKL